jgi:hypothetical protein
MFGKFGRKNSEPDPWEGSRKDPNASPGAAALRRVIAQREDSDPLLGPKIAGKVLLERLLITMRNPQGGVHVESLATALGALAGHACQLAAVHGLRTGSPEYRGLTLNVARGANDDEYFFGDALNLPLAASPHSVWSLVAGAAQQSGAQVPDLEELFRHSASTMGGKEFGLPRFAPGTNAADTPRNYVRVWNTVQPTVEESAPRPEQWPVAYGLAIQNLFTMTNGQFDLGVLTRVVMDSAIATSKLKT